jgi:hypothetical protein
MIQMTTEKKPQTNMLIVEDLGIEVYPCTQRLLDDAARTADLPIVVTSDPLKALASFKPASKDMDHHEINVDTSLHSVLEANWSLAHEASHAIRVLTVPPEQRWVVICQYGEDALRKGYDFSVEGVRKGKYDDIQASYDSFQDWERTMRGWLAGPEEIEVDRYVWQRCPELRNTYSEMLGKAESFVENTLHGDCPYWEPLNSTMCATLYSLLWIAGGWTGKKLTRPFYDCPDALQTGRELLAIVQQNEPNHLGCLKATDQWIEALGLQDIFRAAALSEVSDHSDSSPLDFSVSEDGELVIVG